MVRAAGATTGLAAATAARAGTTSEKNCMAMIMMILGVVAKVGRYNIRWVAQVAGSQLYRTAPFSLYILIHTPVPMPILDDVRPSNPHLDTLRYGKQGSKRDREVLGGRLNAF